MEVFYSILNFNSEIKLFIPEDLKISRGDLFKSSRIFIFNDSKKSESLTHFILMLIMKLGSLSMAVKYIIGKPQIIDGTLTPLPNHS